MKHRRILLCAVILVCSSEARAQQPSQEKGGSRAQERGGAVTQRAPQRTASEGGDLAADNLDRVAATAGQILQILSRDAGLMVEFKRMVAQDASAGGQLLEEADLSESALAERLYEDLRTRALATRLLQRYGYLLPKLNPDSEIAQEQRLVLQERAQILARAAEKGDEGRGALAGERNAGCDPQEQTDCGPQRRALQKTRGLNDPRLSDGSLMEQRSPREEYPTQPLRPDALAVFERIEVREMQQKNRQELIQRLEQESTVVKISVTTSGNEEAALQQAAMQQRQRVLEALRRAPISGRLVVHIRQGQKGFAGSADDLELRAGDTLEIPKQPGFVTIVGQVYNSNAITYAPGKNAGWYLSRAGGATGLANKKAIFIVRANGSVTSRSSGPWSGGVLSSPIGPGDTIVVPEKAVLGGNSWKNVVAIAQIAQAAALAAAVAIP